MLGFELAGDAFRYAFPAGRVRVGEGLGQFAVGWPGELFGQVRLEVSSLARRSVG